MLWLVSHTAEKHEWSASPNFAVMAEPLNLNSTHCLAISPHIFCPFFWIITFWPDTVNYFFLTMTSSCWSLMFTFVGNISELVLEWNTPSHFLQSCTLFPPSNWFWLISRFSLSVTVSTVVLLSTNNCSCWILKHWLMLTDLCLSHLCFCNPSHIGKSLLQSYILPL